MNKYETIACKIFTPLAQKFNLEFAVLSEHDFFLIGYGFAFWIFIDTRERRTDVWYVSVNENGKVLTHTMMYIQKERFDPNNAIIYGKPSTYDEHIEANLRVDAAWLMSKFQDVLSGDKTWLIGYPDDGGYNRSVTKFLAPYFKSQGYPVIESE